MENYACMGGGSHFGGIKAKTVRGKKPVTASMRRHAKVCRAGFTSSAFPPFFSIELLLLLEASATAAASVGLLGLFTLGGATGTSLDFLGGLTEEVSGQKP